MTISRLSQITTLSVAAVLFADSCPASEFRKGKERLPLWEVGLVGIAASLPHYRGSDEHEDYLFPLPYFIYRGEKLEANREGVRGIFWKHGTLETDLTLSGNPPVSDDNTARAGMPGLDAMVEMGPALRHYFYKIDDRNAFFLQGNLHMAFSFDFDDGLEVTHEGYTSELSMYYKNSHLLSQQEIYFHLSLGAQFADASFHRYFYDVPAEYVTQERDSYSAGSGYSGFQVSGSLMKELSETVSFGLYSRWTNCSGAVYEDSPLVKTTDNYVLGCLLLWKIGQSEEFQK